MAALSDVNKRTQLKLLCVCSPVRSALVHGCLGGTQNARSRCCSGCVQLAVAHGFCCYCCMLRYCCVRGVLGALLSVSLRPNKFLCLLGAFAGSPRALQECAWASSVQFLFLICFPNARARGVLGALLSVSPRPKKLLCFFECLRLLGARVADCTWAAGT